MKDNFLSQGHKKVFARKPPELTALLGTTTRNFAKGSPQTTPFSVVFQTNSFFLLIEDLAYTQFFNTSPQTLLLNKETAIRAPNPIF